MKRKMFILSFIIFLALMVSTPVHAIQSEGVDGVSASKGGTVASCAEFKEITKPIYNIIMIGAPSLLFLFGTIDFGRAVAAGDEKEMKKATSDFLKRLIICVVILLLPTLINLIMGWTTFGDLSACF
jgi:hypothetical protein